MTLPAVHPALATRLEKVAADNGFDLPRSSEGPWLAFASTHAPLRLWLSASDPGLLHAAISQTNVARALGADGAAPLVPLPEGACAALTVGDIPALHHLVRRAFDLSRTLPDQLLRTFQKQAATLPLTTEAERLVVQRVGQDIFRQGLLDYWEGRCAITGLSVPELLRASHIKPWSACATDAERLDIHNGLLLAPHLDAAFDRGFLTIADDGLVLVSPRLTPENRKHLGLVRTLRTRALADGHRAYLPWHRERVFR